MKTPARIRHSLAVAMIAFVPARVARAQCTPAWDTAIGTPGIGNGYVGAFGVWNDGSGNALYVGGSFQSIGGQNIRFLARWNSSANTWSQLGGGIIQENTTFIAAITPFDPGGGERLIVGGAFGSAAGTPGTKSLAAWSGSTWSATGSAFVNNTADSVWALKAWNGRLYVGGGFTNVGSVSGANGIASWDGQTWSALGSGIAGSFSPVVFELETFNDGTGEALYAAGRFSSVGGVPGTALIAKWNGSAWSSVGGGLTPQSATGGIETSAVFNDGSGPAIFVGGNQFTPPGQPLASVAKWNGQVWTSVGAPLGGRTTALFVFNDGSGPALYNGGTAQVAINYVARLTAGQWVTLDGGVGGPGLPSFPGGSPGNPSVFSLGEYAGRMYVGGNFTLANGQQANGIVARTACAACYPDCTGDGVLTIADFACFQTAFVQGSTYADCDGSGTLTIADFGCFQTRFVQGCP